MLGELVPGQTEEPCPKCGAKMVWKVFKLDHFDGVKMNPEIVSQALICPKCKHRPHKWLNRRTPKGGKNG